MKIGAQLYTVRDFCKTTEDFAKTLERVAQIGYTTVQVSGTCAYDPAWLDRELKKNGLTCPLTHISPDRIRDDTLAVIRDHEVFGCGHIGIGALPKAPDGLAEIDTFIADFLPAAKTIREHGKRLLYHNHQFEFGRYNKEKTYLEHILESFPQDLLGITLDTYWVQVGGGNPAEWLTKLRGRVPCIHLKDLAIERMEQRMAPVGSGNLNFDAILSAAESAGTEYLFVEQDDAYGKDPFEELSISCRYLQSLGLS